MKNRKKFLCSIVLAGLGFLSLHCMEGDSAFGSSVNKVKSLKESAIEACFNKLYMQSVDEIKHDLALLPTELQYSIAVFIDDNYKLFEATSDKIEALFTLGANPNISNKLGNTALIEYIRNNKFSVAQALLKYCKEFKIKLKVHHKNLLNKSASDLLQTTRTDNTTKENIKKLIQECEDSSLLVKSKEFLLTPWRSLFSSKTTTLDQTKLEQLYRTYIDLPYDDSLNYIHGLNETTKESLKKYLSMIMPSGLTHLHCAKTPLEVQKLLDWGVSTSTETCEGERPIHTVIKNGYVEAAIFLAKKSSREDCCMMDKSHMTPLCYAVLLGNIKLVKTIIKKRASSLYVYENGKEIISPICLLAKTNNDSLIPLILTDTVLARLSHNVRFYAMAEALEHDKSELFSRLIPSGSTLDTYYDTLSTYKNSTYSNNLNFLLYLIKHNRTLCLEKIFFGNGFSDGTQLSFDLNSKNSDGNTPLMFAAFFMPEIVSELIERDVLLNTRDVEGNTVLHLMVAKCKNNELLIPLLCNVDSTLVSIQNSDGDTPLHTAVKNDNPEAVQILLNCNADKSIKNNEGKTAFDLCSELELPKLDCEYHIAINLK